ncbi:hypothetical protein G6F43_011661 [Rhizopus delemar]|nr:hypothetical protein G6F43_011661 [Rhizopus delemar]
MSVSNSDYNSNNNVDFNATLALTEEQQETLYQQFAQRYQAEYPNQDTSTRRNGIMELPEEIWDKLNSSSRYELQANSKRFIIDTQRYVAGDWTKTQNWFPTLLQMKYRQLQLIFKIRKDWTVAAWHLSATSGLPMGSCQKQIPVQGPEEYNVSNMLSFLMEHNRLSVQTLNGYRSTIASVYSQLHSNQPPLASQPEITSFFKAKKGTEVSIPTVDKLETWDINILILYIRKELSPSSILTLGQLQLKVILLMCINTMWRPRSVVGRIQWRDVQFTHTDGIPDSVWLHIRQPKETNTKSIQLGVIQEEDLCFVLNLFRFMELTNQHRQHLAVDHTLFLRYLEVYSKPTTSVQLSTVGKWVQTAMEKTGVDRRYKAHSLQSATSTKAVILGVPIDQVKDHANWSLNSNTFEKFYYRPPRRRLRSTTSSTNVGEEESENVIRTRPWKIKRGSES